MRRKRGKQMFMFLMILLVSYGKLFCQDFALPLKIQPNEYLFEEIKYSTGTPIRDVTDLIEDKQGFVWIASKHGLLRYDGHHFKLFSHIPGDDMTIIDTELLSLFILGDTLLLAGSMHGVSMMDIRTEKFTNLSEDEIGNQLVNVDCFYLDGEEKLWIGTVSGPYSFNSDFTGIINHNLQIPPIKKGNPAFAQRVYDIVGHPVDSNLLMLGTEAGLISFDKQQNALHKIYPNTRADFYRSKPPVYGLIADGNYLWTQSWMSGIPRFDVVNETWENFAYPNEKNNTNIWTISGFLNRNDKQIWVCDWDRGLCLYNKGEDTLRTLPNMANSQIIKNPEMKVFMQKDSTLWLANNDGLWKQNRRKNRFHTIDIPYYYTWIMPVFHDKSAGDYYLGMVHKTYGVACLNVYKNTWTYLQTENNPQKELNTYDIFKDANNTIWIGAGGRGLWYVDKENACLKSFLPPDQQHEKVWRGTIFKIFEDSRKNLWIGTGKHGVARLNAERTQAFYYENNPADSTSMIEGTYVRAIAEDNKGRIWIGNYKGFCTFDTTTGKFSREIERKLYQATGIRPGHTYSIVKDTTGAMWLTMVGQGLIKIKEKKKGDFNFEIFDTEKGLKDLSVKYMTTDPQGNLWIVNNGLLYFNPYDESFMLIDDRNGLLENLSGDDRITVDCYGNVFGGNQIGVKWLDKVKIPSKSKVSNLIVESFLVNGNAIDLIKGKDLSFNLSTIKNKNNFTFCYNAICFEDYDQVRFRYKLEGLENDWNVPTRNREARYTNLKPGKYRFFVDVAYKGKSLGYNKEVCFEIRQVFWKRAWFVLLSFAILIAIVFTLYSYRRKQQEKQKNLRLKIAADLHDDIGSTLSGISIMSDLLQLQSDNNADTEKMIGKIGTDARNMLESMDDIIWSVVPQNDKMENLVLRIQEYAIPLFESKNIVSSITFPKSLNSLYVPMEKRQNIFLIVKEAVNNLVKYSECTRASIDFSCSHSMLTIVVTDNGNGFDTTKDYDRNGLRNIKYRAEKIGAKLIINSVEGKGTDVKLSVKMF